MDNPRLDTAPETTPELPRPETWAASAIGIYEREDVRKKQMHLGLMLEQRACEAAEKLDFPGSIKDSLNDFIVAGVLQRFHHENAMNHTSYSKRLVCDLSEIPLEMIGAHERAMVGNATPDDLIKIRSTLGMPSIELAKLSHIGGLKIELLEPMRKSINAALVENGATLFTGDEMHQKLTFIGSDSMVSGDSNSEDINALLMTRSRYLAQLPDGTYVREKSQFILRVDELSDMSDRLKASFSKIKVKPESDWAQRVQGLISRDDFQAAANILLENNVFNMAIPMVTTTYAHNPETERLAEEVARQAKYKRPAVQYAAKQAVAGNVLFVQGVDATLPN